jgi:type II secretory pathway pseudopilin PulG
MCPAGTCIIRVMTTQPRSGTTLLELLLVLSLAAVLLGAGTAALTGVRDRLAAAGACQRFVASLSLARAAAQMHGGAVVVVDAALGEWQVTPAPYSPHAGSGRAAGVTIAMGAQDPVIRFDAFGLGRMANRTVTFTRGRAQARLTLSIYGRASRCL